MNKLIGAIIAGCCLGLISLINGCSSTPPPSSAQASAESPAKNDRAAFERELQQQMNSGAIPFKSMKIQYPEGTSKAMTNGAAR